MKYLSGAWQLYASELLPPDRFPPLLDWNVRAWLDRDREAAEAEADDPGVRFKIARLVDALREPFADQAAEAVALRAAARRRVERAEERRRRKALAKFTGEPEVLAPEALARLLEDRDDATALAAIRCVGALLAGLRASGGRKAPHESEREGRDKARRAAGSLARVGGVLKPRANLQGVTIPTSVEDADEALANTKDEYVASFAASNSAGSGGGGRGAPVGGSSSFSAAVLGEEEEGDDLSRGSGSSRASSFGGSSVASGAGSSRAGSSRAGSSRGRGGRGAGRGRLGRGREGGRRRAASPMDFALDAPGLLENLLVCTTRGSSLVRSAAAEELQRAAAEDEVATIAWRVLEILERGGEESGRVKALEWINTCVSERYQDVVDAAAEIGASRAVSSAESSGLLPNGFETAATDFSLARDSVDLEAGYDAADAETPNVAVLLSREGVAGAASAWTTRRRLEPGSRRSTSSRARGRRSRRTNENARRRTRGAAGAWRYSRTRAPCGASSGASRRRRTPRPGAPRTRSSRESKTTN